MQDGDRSEVVDRAGRPLRVVGDDVRGTSAGSATRCRSRSAGRTRGVGWPMSATLNSRPSMNCSTRAGWRSVVTDLLDRPSELARGVHDAGSPDADRAVFPHRLDDEREGEVAGFVRAGEDAARGRRDAPSPPPRAAAFHAVLPEGEAQHLGRRARGEGIPRSSRRSGTALFEPRVAGRATSQRLKGAVGIELGEASPEGSRGLRRPRRAELSCLGVAEGWPATPEATSPTCARAAHAGSSSGRASS